MSEQKQACVSPLATRTSSRLEMATAVNAATVAAPAHQRDELTKAMKNCLRSPSFYGCVADSFALGADCAELQAVLPEFARLQRAQIVWNSALDLAAKCSNPDQVKLAFTTLLKDPHSRFCGASVWRSMDSTVWMHKSPSGDWRVGESLGTLSHIHI